MNPIQVIKEYVCFIYLQTYRLLELVEKASLLQCGEPRTELPLVEDTCRKKKLQHFLWHALNLNDYGFYFTDRFSPIHNVKMHSLKQLPEPASSRSHDEASSSSSMNWKDTRLSQEDEISQGHHTGSSDVSPVSRDGKSGPLSLALTEYKICKTDGLADASTQTEENSASRPKSQETCTRGVSTEENCPTQVPKMKDELEICTRDNVSHPPSVSSPLSSKTETLESLIRADSAKTSSFKIHKEEDNNDIHMPTNNTRLKASHLLMHLISCGSISVKNHSFDLIPSYKPGFSHSKFPSPLFSTSIIMGELDCLSENSRLLGLRLEDKESFSGSIVETKLLKEDGDDRHNSTALRRSSSYNAEM